MPTHTRYYSYCAAGCEPLAYETQEIADDKSEQHQAYVHGPACHHPHKE